MAARRGSPWIDVSVPLRTGLAVWPGDPSPQITQPTHLDRGDEATVSALEMGVHTGTHVDAPSHYLRAGATVDAWPFAVGVGRARVIAVRSRRAIEPEELATHRIRRGERLLFRTPGAARCYEGEQFFEGFVTLSEAGALYLAGRGVRLVGVDTYSVGSFAAGGREAHEALLRAGVWVLEGLDLARVPAGPVELVCLPLRIAGVEGAPARAFVRPVNRPSPPRRGEQWP